MPLGNKLECGLGWSLPLEWSHVRDSGVYLELWVLLSIGRLLTLPVNIRYGRKWISVSNTQSYYCTATVTTVKSFIAQVKWEQK